jgi:hypothetical protein
MSFDARPTLPASDPQAEAMPINPMIIGRLHAPERDSPALTTALDTMTEKTPPCEYGTASVYRMSR